ncbi:MAG: GntR family transcriptional regulator [Burkholderiaceae bacterium]
MGNADLPAAGQASLNELNKSGPSGQTSKPAKGIRAGRVPLVQTAYQEIRQRILDLHWPPGFTMLEQEVAETLGMSRTPVREALIRLQEERLVEVVPRHGMRVLPISAKEMRDIYQVLTSLEATAAELAATAMSAQGSPESKSAPGTRVKNEPVKNDCLAALEQATRDMEQAIANEDRKAWAAADERFHQSLVALSGNLFLVQTVNRFWDMAHRARMMTLELRSIPKQSTSEHRDLCEAIRQGNSLRAAQIHRAHRERGIPEMTRILQIIEHKQETR